MFGSIRSPNMLKLLGMIIVIMILVINMITVITRKVNTSE